MKPFVRTCLNEGIAYHGSPYDFNYFSENMIGQGEGASGFGFGFYFTEDKDDAKDYARKLEREKGEAILYKVRIPNKNLLLNIDVDLEKQSKYVISCLNKAPNDIKINLLKYANYFDFTEFKKEIDDNIGEYDFKIGDKEYNKFLYDEILKEEFINSFGNDFYSTLKQVFGDEYKASEFLYKIGIKGNIHRGFNITHYVIFNSDDIEIIQKTKPKIKYFY